jgi:hypothetical protein
MFMDAATDWIKTHGPPAANWWVCTVDAANRFMVQLPFGGSSKTWAPQSSFGASASMEIRGAIENAHRYAAHHKLVDFFGHGPASHLIATFLTVPCAMALSSTCRATLAVCRQQVSDRLRGWNSLINAGAVTVYELPYNQNCEELNINGQSVTINTFDTAEMLGRAGCVCATRRCVP